MDLELHLRALSGYE